MKYEPPVPIESATDIKVTAIEVENPTKEGGSGPIT